MSPQKTRLCVAALAASALATPAMAAAGDTFIRVRGIVVAPNEKSGGILPALPTETVRVNDAVTPEVDVTQMVTDNIGFELIAATSKHSVSGASGTTGSIGKLASTWVLPPTLTTSVGSRRACLSVVLKLTVLRAAQALKSAASAIWRA